MNIVIIGPAHPYRGGIAQFDEVLAAQLVREGHRVRIVNFRRQYPAFLFPGKTQYTDAPAPAGLQIDRQVDAVNPLNWRRVGHRLKAERPDLLIVRFWMPFFGPALGCIAGIVRRNGHTRVVALADNIVPHEHRPGDRALTRYFLRRTDGVLYMSAQVGRDLEQLGYKGAQALSPHPIYDSYGQPVSKSEACEQLGLDPGVNYALFFGFIRDYKGLDLLLRAWAMLKAEAKTAGRRLLVAGEYYGNREKYERLMRELGLTQEDVTVRDQYIPEERVRYYFSAAELVVQPYKSATQSGVTQVAYHFGVPMIVTDVGGLPEIVPDGRVGYVVPPDAGALAGAIARFWDEGRAEEFRSHITAERQRFTWSALTRQFITLADQISKPNHE